MSGPIVVLGARGFVGSHLTARLTQAGREVRAGSRNPEAAKKSRPALDWVRADVEDDASLDAAFEGADAVVYLVHQMRAQVEDLTAAEVASAERVRHAAERAGVRRIVYLGGPKPTGDGSHHLEARLETGEALRCGSVSTIELRAGMIVGAGSESWLIVRDLSLRLPVMVLPKWLKHRSEPIGIRDVVAGLEAAIDLDDPACIAYDLPGPETLSGREILLRIAGQAGIRPLMIEVPVLTPSLSSHWIRLVTRADYTIARQLVDGLTSDLVATGPTLWERCPALPRTPLDQAIREALDDEPDEALSSFGRQLERMVSSLSLSP